DGLARAVGALQEVGADVGVAAVPADGGVHGQATDGHQATRQLDAHDGSRRGQDGRLVAAAEVDLDLAAGRTAEAGLDVEAAHFDLQETQAAGVEGLAEADAQAQTEATAAAFELLR